MRTLISQCSKPHFLFHLSSLSRGNRIPSFFIQRKSLLNPQRTICSCLTASSTANLTGCYNGWDDLRIQVDSGELGESNQIRKFLFALGIDDKKYVFTCMLGFVLALAISKVKVSSIIVFPAATIVFAVGFLFGSVNSRPYKGLSIKGSKRRAKDDSSRIIVEKLKILVGFFDELDIKVSELKGDIKKAIDFDRIEMCDLKDYLNVMESIGGVNLNARDVAEDCIGSVSGENQEVEKNLNQKPNREKKEINHNGFDLFKLMGSFLKDNAIGSNSNKTNVARRDSMTKNVNNRAQEDLQGSVVEERASSSVFAKDDDKPNRGSSTDATRKDILSDRNEELRRILQNGKMNTTEAYKRTETFLNADGFDYRSLGFTKNRKVSLNMSSYREIRKWASDVHMGFDVEYDICKRHFESEALLKHQKILQKSSATYESSRAKEYGNYGNRRANLEEENISLEDNLDSSEYQSKQENDVGYFSSSTFSDDVLFDKCLMKANELLKQAKECLKVRNDEILAEEMLSGSSKLLCQAIVMKPMSLLAIGQLGNTYLLQGELKLRISRELRSLLSTSDDVGVKEQSNFLTPVPSRDKLASLLLNVCEECEQLLGEAGRQYRMALSIDGDDARALYNWGLALSFRAQLLADIGPEAAPDADKLFLAAIDKFDAMMSRSNVHTPEALFRWGVALQQRSRLRPTNSQDKVKLLQQAKRLYEDALDMGSENLQVRKALSSCISELDFGDV